MPGLSVDELLGSGEGLGVLLEMAAHALREHPHFVVDDATGRALASAISYRSLFGPAAGLALELAFSPVALAVGLAVVAVALTQLLPLVRNIEAVCAPDPEDGPLGTFLAVAPRRAREAAVGGDAAPEEEAPPPPPEEPPEDAPPPVAAPVAEASVAAGADAAAAPLAEVAAPDSPPGRPRPRRFDGEVAATRRRHCVPLARWSDAVEAPPGAPLLFVSGQIGADDRGILRPDARGQCAAAFENLRRSLEDCGRTMADVVSLDVALAHGKCSLGDYREAERAHLDGAALPAVTLTFAAGLATPNILVSLSCVAA